MVDVSKYELNESRFGNVSPLVMTRGCGIALGHTVIEKRVPGHILVDDPGNPTAALICRDGGERLLVGEPCRGFGEVVSAALTETMRHHQFRLIAGPEWADALAGFLRRSNTDVRDRVFYRFDPEAFAKGPVPVAERGTRVVDMDLSFLENSGIRMRFWKSHEHFLANGVGCALMVGEERASLCYSAFAGGGEQEVQINTMKEFEGRGYATRVARAFCERCTARGQDPGWSCLAENGASVVLAKKLGFEPLETWMDVVCSAA